MWNGFSCLSIESNSETYAGITREYFTLYSRGVYLQASERAARKFTTPVTHRSKKRWAVR